MKPIPYNILHAYAVTRCQEWLRRPHGSDKANALAVFESAIDDLAESAGFKRNSAQREALREEILFEAKQAQEGRAA